MTETAFSTSPAMPAPAGAARRRWVAMGVVGAILLLGGVGLNAATAYLQLNFKKQPVALRHPVLSLPGELGPWVQVSIDAPMPPEIEHELGTKEYVQREYVDTRQADPDVLEQWRGSPQKTEELRKALRNSVLSKNPRGMVTLHVAYYTGGVDTVPHIPDRCMVAGGYDPVGSTQAILDLGDRAVTTSYVQFQQRAGHATPTTINVAYFFQVNGDYEHDAITGVRKRLQNLFERHGYFAKIECMSIALDPAAEPSQAAIADFLSSALPQIEKLLPDWEAVLEAERDADRAASRAADAATASP